MAEVILRLNEGDATVTGSLGRLQTPGRGVVTVTGGLGPIAALGAGDTLFILGHGNTTQIGAYDARGLADLLSGAGLKSGVNIQLVACNSGTGGAPFALELKTQLVNKKIIPGDISGGTNFMQVKNDGSLKVAGYNFGTASWLPETVDAKTVVMTPWGARQKNVKRQYST